MKRLLLILAIGAGSGGCATIETGVQRAGQVVDTLNDKAMWQLCEGTTLGGYQRLAPELRNQVNSLCVARGGPWVAPGG